jgi:metal-sulfur cluster biosynthetic enzyme
MSSHDSIITESPGTPDVAITEAHVYAAIADVLDPELDEPLVKLGFIDRVQVDGPDVTVVFKLPTYWCSPNFAYLMAGDLRARLRALPGIRTAHVELLDHCAEDEITTSINQGKSFAEAFAGEVSEDEDLEELRRTFLRKGFLMRQDRLLRQMLKAGLDEATILSLKVADLVVDEISNQAFVATSHGAMCLAGAGLTTGAYLRKGSVIGLFQAKNDLLITDDAGQPVAPGGLQAYLRRSRSVRLNILFNTTMCKSLFRARYEHVGASESDQEEDEL